MRGGVTMRPWDSMTPVFVGGRFDCFDKICYNIFNIIEEGGQYVHYHLCGVAADCICSLF